MRSFSNRTHAGKELAQAVSEQLPTTPTNLLVLALPRGGVPVAAEVAKSLNAELDLLIVRKLGLPWHPELAIGAIASGGIRILNDDVVRYNGVNEETIAEVEREESRELQRRTSAYRGARPIPVIAGRTVILVDDGIATGATMLAAVAALRKQQPEALIVAVPVAPPETIMRLEEQADQIICLLQPTNLYAIGTWYQDFSQTSDEEVRQLLAEAWQQ